MSLHDEKAAALTEILAATGEPVIWNGKTYQALVTDNPLSQELALGGFEAKGNCTIKIPRSAFTDERPELGDPVEFNGEPYRVTRVTDHPQYPMIVLVAEPQN
jgi:hypothetical protein